MHIAINLYGLPILPEIWTRQADPDHPQTRRQTPDTRCFPSLFRLYDRRTGAPHRDGGGAVEVFSADAARAAEILMHNRDPRHFEVRIDTPLIGPSARRPRPLETSL